MNKKLVGIIIVLLLIVVVGVVTLFIMNDHKEKDNSNDSILQQIKRYWLSIFRQLIILKE